MNFRSLAPFRGTTPARPEAFLFGPLQREIDRLFDDFTRGLGVVGPQGQATLMPSIDVTESDKEIVITAELPGLERKDVEITLENDVLTIRGEKRVEEEGSDNNQGKTQGAQGKSAKNGGDGEKKNYHLSERTYGVFYRVLQLPAGIDPKSVQATMSNGVLKITIPKPARSEAKKIEVKEAA
jgi:HSP20 family protein